MRTYNVTVNGLILRMKIPACIESVASGPPISVLTHPGLTYWIGSCNEPNCLDLSNVCFALLNSLCMVNALTIMMSMLFLGSLEHSFASNWANNIRPTSSTSSPVQYNIGTSQWWVCWKSIYSLQSYSKSNLGGGHPLAFNLPSLAALEN